MRLIEKVWFQGHNAKWWLVPLLLPMTVLFFLISWIRRFAFRIGINKSIDVKTPVIVVGNIGVGGNGKTPLVIHLIELCRQQGLNPGVLSRGYGGRLPSNKHYPLTLDQYTPVEQTGDEPFLIYHRCQAPVVVGPDRVASAEQLKQLGCNVIIADDGLQHYRLKRDCEVIVVDGKRGFGNGFLLPAGPLREGQWRLSTSDLVVVNGENKVGLVPPYAQMSLQATQVVNLKTGEKLPVAKFVQSTPNINALAGIGDPQRFFDTLITCGFELASQKSFNDHHHFSIVDFSEIEPTMPLLMTEKDAVKCRRFTKDNWWYISVSACFTEEGEIQLVKAIQSTVIS